MPCDLTPAARMLARWRPRVIALPVLALGAVLAVAGSSHAVDGSERVHAVEISGEIDLGLAPYLDRALRAAERDGAAAVLLEIDTPGGRLDAVLQMRDSLLRSPVRTIAYVDQTAFSAGALVALASEEIHMAPGAVLGAATPVAGGTGETASEKVVSAVRTTFRATAEERGRDPRVAEAMVDPDVEIEGLSPRGELLTLTATEARDRGYADSIAADRATLLETVGLADRELVAARPSLAERVVRFVTNPVLASLLLTLGMWLVLGDLLTGGVGLAAGAGVVLLAAFFWGHLLAGLAGWEDVALVVLGIGLILVELLVVPGFGVPGVLGLAALLGGSFLAMLNRDFDFVDGGQIARAATTVGVSFVAIAIGLGAMLAYLSRRGGPPGGLVLRTQLGASVPVTQRASGGWLRWFGSHTVLASDRESGPAAPDGHELRAGPEPGEGEPRSTRDASGGVVPPRPGGGTRGALTGATGIALSDLRPAGVADVGGRRVDVVTEGEYVAAGEPIEIVSDEGYRRVVRRQRS